MQTFITLYILLGVYLTFCGFYYEKNKKDILNDNSVKTLILAAVVGVLMLPITVTIGLIIKLLKKIG